MEAAINVKVGAETSELQKGFDGAVSAIQELTRSITQLNTTFSSFKGFATLAQGSTQASNAMAKVAEATQPLTTSVKVIGKSFDEIKAPIFAAADALNSKFAAAADKAEAEAVSARASVKGLADEMKKTAVSATATGAALAGPTKAGADKAGNALLNLGRIAQDAPFGFIGISNNINPLLESFQRLKTETGSTKAAFSALGSSLIGGAGLGLAVSVATGLLTVLASNGFFSAGKAADDAKKKTEDYKKSIEGIFDGAAKEATEVQSLIAVLNSETATRERKLATIKELNKINPEVFGGLKLEGNLVTGLDASYKSYIENLKTVIAVKIKQGQLENITKSILEKEGVTLTGNAKVLKTIVDNINKTAEAKVKDAQSPYYKQQQKAQGELNLLYKQSADIQKEIGELQSGVKVDPIKTEKAKKDTKDIKTLADALKELQLQLQLINNLQAVGQLGPTDADKQRVNAYTTSLTQLFERGATVSNENVKDIAENIRQLTTLAAKPINVQVVGIQSSQIGPAPDLKIDTNTPLHILDGIIAKQNEMKDKFADISASIVNVLGGAFQSVFDSIATRGTNVFKAFGDAIKGVIVRLVSAAATAAILSIIIGGITGGASKAFNFKSLFAQFAGIPKFAGGGATSGQTLAIVGDNPSGKEYMLPSESLNELASKLNGAGGGGAFIAETIIAGQDLRLVLKRADAGYNRGY